MTISNNLQLSQFKFNAATRSFQFENKKIKVIDAYVASDIQTAINYSNPIVLKIIWDQLNNKSKA